MELSKTEIGVSRLIIKNKYLIPSDFCRLINTDMRYFEVKYRHKISKKFQDLYPVHKKSKQILICYLKIWSTTLQWQSIHNSEFVK